MFFNTGRLCDSLWTFERLMDMELRGSERDTIRDVSKSECEDRCLSETGFSCLSANYDHLSRVCTLSDGNRYSNQAGFAPSSGVDYLENQCQAGKL